MFHITSMQMARTDVKGGLVIVICPDQTDHITRLRVKETWDLSISTLDSIEPLTFFLSLTFRNFVISPKYFQDTGAATFDSMVGRGARGCNPAAPAADVFNFILFHAKFVFRDLQLYNMMVVAAVVAQGQGLHRDYAPHDAGWNADDEERRETRSDLQPLIRTNGNSHQHQH